MKYFQQFIQSIAVGGILNEIILVGAEADFDFPQLVISGDNILSVQIVCTMDQYSMEAILPGCVLDPGLVNRDIATVGERQKTVKAYAFCSDPISIL